MMTALVIIALAAFICAVLSAVGYCPLWVAVILLCIAVLVQVLPLK